MRTLIGRLVLLLYLVQLPRVAQAQRFPDYDDGDNWRQYSPISDLFDLVAILFSCFLVVILLINFFSNWRFSLGALGLGAAFGIAVALFGGLIWTAAEFNVNPWVMLSLATVGYLVLEKLWRALAEKRDRTR
jgi:hypothetical protein